MRDAVACALAGIAAADPAPLVRRALGQIEIEPPVTMIAAGKAADAMARATLESCGTAISQGLVIAPRGIAPPARATGRESILRIEARHPIPDRASLEAGKRALALAERCGPYDTLLTLLSGGASALMTWPLPGLRLRDVQDVTGALQRAGATIQELNCVRKHLDLVKGGRLALQASPARVITLVLSDVIGAPLDVIGSGPTTPDPTTVADALAVLERYGATRAATRRIGVILHDAPETPKPGSDRLARVEAHVVGDNRTAREGAARRARSLGYKTTVVPQAIRGEARVVGERLARAAIALRPSGPAAFVYGGETTVTVRGGGRGGRCQELALAAAIVLDGHAGITLAAAGTDGVDGPTDAAGAAADGTTIERARAAGLDHRAALDRNDTYGFWTALGDAIVTGATGTNVMDIVVVTIAGPTA